MNYILLFGMPGGGELFFIVLIVIMLFGSKKIPELARGLGKGMREIKNATGDIQREIREGARDINSMKDSVNVEKQVKDLIKGDKEKKSEVAVEGDESSVSNSQASTIDEQENSNPETETQNPQPVSQTVRRKSPYDKEESENTTENA